jgi:hypothetical protein
MSATDLAGNGTRLPGQPVIWMRHTRRSISAFNAKGRPESKVGRYRRTFPEPSGSLVRGCGR